MKMAAVLFGILFALAKASWADDFGKVDGLKGLKFQRSSQAQTMERAPDWRSDWDNYLAYRAYQGGISYEQYQGSGLRLYLRLRPNRASPAAADDADKLFQDTDLAIDAVAGMTGLLPSYGDGQKFVSADFYKRIGEARFNPDTKQTGRIAEALSRMLKDPKVKLTQAEVIFEALRLTDGNVTMAMGSLGEIFCEQRRKFLPRIADMEEASGKNYYRFVGMFTGLHNGLLRSAGAAGGYGNIVGNPLAYLIGKTAVWWADYFQSGKVGDYDVREIFSVDGHNNIIDKVPQLDIGLSAAKKLREARNISF